MQLVGGSPNNATFVPVSQYFGWLDAFAALFEQSGSDWPKFHQAASDLGDLAEPERTAALQSLIGNPTTHDPRDGASCPPFAHRIVSAAR
jgi:predicted aminopeptidase